MAESIAADIKAQQFETVPSQILLPEALKVAFTYHRSIYGCIYTELAIQANCQLITADERLANAFAARFPIQWLGVF